MIPEEVINRIRERADIVEVVGAHLSLTKAGQHFKGLCPFHSEKTPSFIVSPLRQIFHCFGCGEGGNVLTFLMKIDGCTFPDAVRALGQRLGIAVEEQAASPSARQRAELRERLFALNRAAAEFFHRILLSDAEAESARAYLRGRGITSDTIARFGLGYAPAAWEGTLKALVRTEVKIEDLAAAGLVVPRENGSGFYDRFRGRVIFPIRDLQRRVIGFGGRVLDETQPKYLNSPETPLFSKGRTLYALEAAREGTARLDEIIIVEGYFDAISLHQSGLTNTVATLGTALTAEHVEVLRRFTDRIVLLFDPDPAGVRAALRTMDLFIDSGLTVKVGSLPTGEDPDTFIRARGPEGFRQALGQASSLLDFTVRGCLKTSRQGSIEDRVRCVEEVLELLQKLSNPVEKAAAVRQVADHLGLEEKLLADRYRTLARRRTVRSDPQVSRESKQALPLPKDEEVLVRLLLHEKLTPEMLARLSADAFTDDRAKRLMELAQAAAEQGTELFEQILSKMDADDPSQTLVRALSLSELPYDDVATAFEESLTALKLRRLADEIQQVKAAQAVAERAGQAETVTSLVMRQNALQQEKQRLLGVAGPASIP